MFKKKSSSDKASQLQSRKGSGAPPTPQQSYFPRKQSVAVTGPLLTLPAPPSQPQSSHSGSSLQQQSSSKYATPAEQHQYQAPQSYQSYRAPEPQYQQQQHYFPPPPPQEHPVSPAPQQGSPPLPTAVSPMIDHNYPPPPQQSEYQERNGTYQSEPTTVEHLRQSYATPPPPGGKVGHHGMPNMADMSINEKEEAPAYDDNEAGRMPCGAPARAHFVGGGATVDDVGRFDNGSYRVSHRDTNTIVTVILGNGCELTAKSGVMIAMSSEVTLKGVVNFSFKKVVIGGEITYSLYTGPGEVLLAPHTLGDVTILKIGEGDLWKVGRDAYLACTKGIIKDYKGQGVGKGLFSGEGFFIYHMTGSGIVWITSMGAIIRKDLGPGEKYIIDNGHLVAWNCEYALQRAASGGILSGISSGEGLVCKFTGPGTVFMQTRNPVAFAALMQAHGRAA